MARTWQEVKSSLPLAARPIRQCLGCDSSDTTKRGRVLSCRSCEVTYFIPAVQLAARPKS